MRTQRTHSLQKYLMIFILPLALLTIPVQTLADDANPAEGSKTKQYGPGGPHGKPEGSGYKHGDGKGYGHGYQGGHGKQEGSRGKHGYGQHGYRRYGHGGHHSGHGGHGRDPFRHILRFAHQLGLTAEQVQQIRDKQFEFQKQIIELGAQHQIAHLELDKLVHSGNLDESAIRAVGERVKQIKAKKIDGMIEAKISLLKIMTDEQRKKIATLHAHGGGRGHGYKGHHR